MSAVEDGAQFEDEEQHQREDRQRADEAPARMQEKLVGPALPAWRHAFAARPGHGLEADGGAVVAVGVDFVGQRARQGRIGGGPGQLQRICLCGKMRFEFLHEIRVVFGEPLGQELVRYREGGGHFRLAGDGRDGLQLRLDVRADRTGRARRMRRSRLACNTHRGSEEIGQADTHVRHGRHHRRAKLGRQRTNVDEAMTRTCLVHAVEREHHRPPERHQFHRQLEVALQLRGVHHHQQHLGGSKRLCRLVRFVTRDRRPAVAPEQVLERDARGLVGLVETVDRRQLHQRHLVDPHFDEAFLIGRSHACQSFVLRGRAGGGAEDAVLADAGAPDDGHARAAHTAKAGTMQGKNVLGNRHQ